jgi:repressor LexA
MLTNRQATILEFISTFQERECIPPSTRQIQRFFNFKSQTTVIRHLRQLAKNAHVMQLADRSWGLNAKTGSSRKDVPVYGAIPAGKPADSEQESGESISIDPTIFGVSDPNGSKLWFLRAVGDSMCGAGIFDGDLVAIARRHPQPGDIIAALVDETSTTLKRLIYENGRPLLRAANPKYADIQVETLICQGVAVGTIRPRLS